MKNSTAVVLAVLVTVAAGASALLTKPDCAAWTLDDGNGNCEVTGPHEPGATGFGSRVNDSLTGRQAGQSER